MIDINLIRSNPDAVKASLKKKECDVDFSELLSWDAERRALISDVESLKARKNKVSADIPRLKKEGKPVDAIFDEMRKIGEEISEDDKKSTICRRNLQFRRVSSQPSRRRPRCGRQGKQRRTKSYRQNARIRL